MKPTRLYYAAGPGDVVSTFRHWLQGEEDPTQFARTYSAQFYDLIRRLGAQGMVVSSCEREDEEAGQELLVKNVPLKSGNWICRQFKAAFRLTRDVLKFRPNTVIVAEGTTFWTLLLPVRCLGVRVIPTIHCVMKEPNAGMLRRTLEGLERVSLKLLARDCLTASREIESQLPRSSRSHAFLPSYLASRFADLPQATMDTRPFQLLYAGRIEADKGVHDLVEAFRILRSKSDKALTLRFCGTGTALTDLEEQIRACDLEESVFLEGHCFADQLHTFLSQSHVIVVPTSSRFVEGFNQVIVEGVLAGRPVIATSVCPSAQLFTGKAVHVIPPDQPNALADALSSMVYEPKEYAEAARECLTTVTRDVFFSSAHSWRRACETALQFSH